MNTLIKALSTFVVGLIAGAFKAFVLMLMWNWFVSPVFHIQSISFWQVLGLLWVVQLFVGETGDAEENVRWDRLFSILNVCVPERKNEELRQELKQQEEGLWSVMGLYIFSQFAGSGVVLGLGWLVHTFFVAG